MFTVHDLCEMKELPKWSEISLSLYKEFCVQNLFSKTFRYYFVNGASIDVEFREGAMRHLWGNENRRRCMCSDYDAHR